jgi:hypothetical protein
LGHIAGISKNHKFPKDTIGKGLSYRSVELATDLIRWQDEEDNLDLMMSELINQPQFEPYVNVFRRFGFPITNPSIMSIQ